MGFREALLDGIDGKAKVARACADEFSGYLQPRIESVVLAAARPRASTDSVRRAIREQGLGRVDAVIRRAVRLDATEVASRSIQSLRDALGGARAPRQMPVRRAELRARRLARGDSADFAIRLDSGQARFFFDDAQLGLFGGLSRVTGRLIGAEAPDDATIEQVLRSSERWTRAELMDLARDAIREQELAAWQIDPREDPEMTSIAVNDGGDDATCESCEGLHDVTRHYSEWFGLFGDAPGSPNRVCWHRCRCELVPAEVIER